MPTENQEKRRLIWKLEKRERESQRQPLVGRGVVWANGRRFPVRRVGPGCLFWIVLSVILSVTLTILLNLGLFAFGG